jgi:hypothetical protein
MTTNTPFNYNEYRAQRFAIVKPEFDRLAAIRAIEPMIVHEFVTSTIYSYIELIAIGSDSSTDEFVNELESVLDLDYREEYLTLNYDNNAYADPTSADYRSFATACDERDAISKQLTDIERELLAPLADAWDTVDAADLDATPAMQTVVNDVMARIEQMK